MMDNNRVFREINDEVNCNSEFMMAGGAKERTVRAIDVKVLMKILRKRILREAEVQAEGQEGQEGQEGKGAKGEEVNEAG